MKPTECSMVVSLPTGDLRIANRVYRGSKVTIASHEFEADLIVLDIHDFDIILGMDWLAKHRATVDCYRKEVTWGTRSDLLWREEDTFYKFNQRNTSKQDAL